MFCRRLAEVSRLTRGVVVLICDIHYAKLVMDEARRLNMLDGHFFWLWIDASKGLDVFHTVSNKIENDNHEDLNSFSDKDEALKDELIERRKRDDADNNTVKDIGRNTSRQFETHSKEKINKSVEDSINSSIKFSLRRNSRNIKKSEAHSVNNKMLSLNFSQELDSSRNISSEDVRNYNYVNNKGVETSKIEKNSIEKGKMSFLYRDSSRQTSYSKTKNESFNKYVNSINLGSVNAENTLLKQEIIHSSDESRNLKDRVFSSDISEFLMNPTVHMAKVHNVRDTIERRKDYQFGKEYDEVTNNDNVTVIIDNLPIGLLALHPQPMKIGK